MKKTTLLLATVVAGISLAFATEAKADTINGVNIVGEMKNKAGLIVGYHLENGETLAQDGDKWYSSKGEVPTPEVMMSSNPEIHNNIPVEEVPVEGEKLTDSDTPTTETTEPTQETTETGEQVTPEIKETPTPAQVTATSETAESTDSELPPTVPNKVVEQTSQVPQQTAEPIIHEEHHAEPAKPEPKKQEPKQEPKQEEKHGDWRDIHAPSAQIPKTDKEKPAVPTKQEAKKAVDKLVKQSAEVKTLPKTGEENSLLSGMLSFFGIFLVSGVIIYGLEKLVKKGFFK